MGKAQGLDALVALTLANPGGPQLIYITINAFDVSHVWVTSSGKIEEEKGSGVFYLDQPRQPCVQELGLESSLGPRGRPKKARRPE